jgi:hypothetical protein
MIATLSASFSAASQGPPRLAEVHAARSAVFGFARQNFSKRENAARNSLAKSAEPSMRGVTISGEASVSVNNPYDP